MVLYPAKHSLKSTRGRQEILPITEVARGVYFHRRGMFFVIKYFSECIYLPLVFDVYNRLFIDCLGFIYKLLVEYNKSQPQCYLL